jgi:hypothetical protein
MSNVITPETASQIYARRKAETTSRSRAGASNQWTRESRHPEATTPRPSIETSAQIYARRKAERAARVTGGIG